MIKIITLSVLLILGLNNMTLAQSNTNKYSQESKLNSRLSSELKQFWRQGKFASFKGVDQTRINYAAFTEY